MVTLHIDDDFNPGSVTMTGPFPVVGDCVGSEERYAAAMLEKLPVRHGDLGIWFMPSLPAIDQYACKWLLSVDGEFWLACKYFAVRYRPDFHRPVARVVAIVSGDPGSFDPVLASRMAREIALLRAKPPRRDDLVVFPADLLDQSAIIDAIKGRHQSG